MYPKIKYVNNNQISARFSIIFACLRNALGVTTITTITTTTTIINTITTTTYNAAIMACAKGEQWQQASEFFERLLGESV